MFVHLETRSGFSLKEGTFTPEALARRAARLGMRTVALTDRDSLLGAARMVAACEREGIRPILGASVTTRSDDPRGPGGSLVLLAADDDGYANLCTLIGQAHQNHRDDPRIDLERICEHAQGLVAIVGPASPPGRLAIAGRAKEARTTAAPLREAFYGRFHVGIQHRLEPGSAEEIRSMLMLAASLDAPAVATNPVRYLCPEDAPLADVLDAMRRLTGLEATARINAEGHLKSPAAMARLFTERPELAERTHEIAETCTFDLGLGLPRMPTCTQPDPAASLHERCQAGLGRRGMAMAPAVQGRMDHELAMIARMGYGGFFLSVAQIAADIRAMGIRATARGSAASSLVCYLLGISEVDPLHHDLCFERFLNPARSELPDIDLDVESARREDAVAMILSGRSGAEAACVAMVDTFRARSAIRETGKALGLPEGEVGRLATAFPHLSARHIPRAMRELPELEGLRLPGPDARLLLRLATRLDGLPRHIALHPCGIVLAPGDLDRRVPIIPSAAGHRMAQADKDDVEQLGYVKLDVLGVRMLSAMRHALDEIARTTGTKVRLEEIAPDDEPTFELIRSSETIGVFQIESPGQRELLQKLQPRTAEDLIVDISLFRPGPVRSDMVSPYLRRRAEMERPIYAHPDLRPVLRETFGVIVFHEQVIRTLCVIAGWSPTEADHVRRHLDDETLVPGFRAGFLEGAAARGIEPEAAQQVWNQVAEFASFGFCKAHAATFAIPTYESAWLKTHYPAHLVAGLLTHDPGMYPPRLILADARRRGVPILDLDVLRSEAVATVEAVPEGFGVRLGLQDVAGITATEIVSLIRAREERPFIGIEDFLHRSGVSRPVAEALARAGALRELPGGGNRRANWARAAVRPPPRKGGRRAPGSGQLALFTEPDGLCELRDLSAEEAVLAEVETLGMETSGHLLDPYRQMLEAMGTVPAADLRRRRAGTRLIVAGIKVASQTPAIRSGARIVFLSLDDGTGVVEVTIFPSVQGEVIRRVFGHHLLAVGGTLRRTGVAGVSIVAEQVWDIRALRRAWERGELAAAIRHPRTTLDEPVGKKLWHTSPGSAG